MTVDRSVESHPKETFENVWEAIKYVTNVSKKKQWRFHVDYESIRNNLHDQEDVSTFRSTSLKNADD